jgi:intracellular sulfur oxidation DsrE/DsrF family protein
MSKFGRAVLAGLVLAAGSFWFIAGSSAKAQEAASPDSANIRAYPKPRAHIRGHKREAKQKLTRETPALAKKPEKMHRLAVQVNVNDPAAMNLALNNVSNVEEYYRSRLEDVQIEIVAYGPGLHMLREDTSPVKDRIKSMSQTMRNVSFMACGNTRQNMQKAEAKDIPLMSQAKVVESGVVRLMELQEGGWSYIRP